MADHLRLATGLNSFQDQLKMGTRLADFFVNLERVYAY